MSVTTAVIVTAHNEADRLPATLEALRVAFPGARIVVADDGSTDDTVAVARAAGVEVVGGPNVGKGGNATRAARLLGGASSPGRSSRAPASPGSAVSSDAPAPPAIIVLCDGDLATSAGQLPRLAAAVADGDADLAVATFARRVGGGFGLAVGFARWAIRRRCGLSLDAPISGQRAMSVAVLDAVLPFAPGFGMEIGMTVDAARAGYRVREIELDLTHRATGRTWRGFLHRGRQLVDFVGVYLRRR